MNTVTELDQIVGKDNWTQEDCQRLQGLFFRMRDPVRAFRQALSKLAAAPAEASGAEAVKLGLARYFLCQFGQALEILSRGTDNKERRYYQALCCKHLRLYDKALENLELAEARGWDPRQVTLQKAEVQCLGGDVDGAARTLDRFAKSSQDDPDWHYISGMAAEMRGEYEAAVAAYEKARALSARHPGATFRLAYFHDLHGEEELAGDLYRQCIQRLERERQPASADTRPVYANCLMNLAVLYEDAGQYDEAARCLRRVLASNPQHARAGLFLKDVLASKTMTFDEEEAKRIARRNDLLAIPVTDFELSVRARNCLKKMNIRTLGDLLHIGEAELLGFKNFGETSLAEIKSMLATKNLRLGQLHEEGVEPPDRQPESAEVSVGNEGVLATPILQIEFSIRSRRALERLNVRTLGDLAQKTEAELLACRNFGQTSLNEILQRLGEYGLRLREPE